jgi:hypothetical protein
VSKQEELAWEVYKTKFTNLGEGSSTFVMYKLCFLAGYRAAEQGGQPILLESEPILDSAGELVGTRSVEI